MESVRVMFIGDSCCGKSSIAYYYSTGEVLKNCDPTITEQYFREIDVNGIKYEVDVIDAIGWTAQKGLLAKLDFDLIVLLYSMNSKKSFDYIVEKKKELDSIVSRNTKVIVCGNKKDLKEDSVESYVHNTLLQMNAKHYEVSCLQSEENLNDIRHMVDDNVQVINRNKAQEQQSFKCTLL